MDTLAVLREQVEEDEIPGPASAALYLAGFVVTACGLLAASLVIQDSSFRTLIYGLCILGFVISYVGRRQNVTPRSVEVPAALLLVFIVLVGLMTDRVLPFMSPYDLLEDRSKTLPVLLTWLVVFRSFALITDGAVLFCCVPTTAIMGLVGTMAPEPILVAYFVVAVCAAAFMMIHENCLRVRRLTAVDRPTSGSNNFVSQVQMAAICGAAAWILAKMSAPTLQVLGASLGISPTMLQSPTRSNNNFTSSAISITELNQIGVGRGPTNNSSEPVMRVHADHGAYWRGATLDEYTGSGWRNSLVDSQPLEPAPQRTFDPFADTRTNTQTNRYAMWATMGSSPKHTHRLRQRVTLVGSSVFEEIYAAPECVLVETGQIALRGDASGGVHANQMRNIQYYVESDVIDAGPDELRKAPQRPDPALSAKYLQLPLNSTVTDSLRSIAKEATRGLTNNYDRVMALEAWIGARCKYNLQAAAYPADKDVVLYFLNEIKEGDCNSFATSLAVLCRAIGIPARVASGFLPGTMEANSQDYIVRAKDKHLWTEVHFPEYGWVGFDPTSQSEDISTEEDEATRKRDSSLFAFLFHRGPIPPILALMFLSMLSYVLKVEIWDRYSSRRSPQFRYADLPATNLEVVDAYLAACGLLARRGLRRAAHLTPDEFLSDLRDTLSVWPEAVLAMDRLTQLATRSRYGRTAASPEDVRIARDSVTTVKTALKGVSRRMLPFPEAAKA